MHLVTGISHPGARGFSRLTGRYRPFPRRNVVAVASLLCLAWAIRSFLRSRGGFDFSGRSVLITGGSRGFGLLLAREFGRRGARVSICARSEDELLRATDALADAGVEAIGIPCDVADKEAVDRMVERVVELQGGIDVLVNNAGIIQVGPLETMTERDFEEALDVMFWGVVHPTLAALPRMLGRRDGRIVNVTSIGGKVSVPHLLPYNSAKFAAVGFSEGLGAELQGTGISVVTVVPGLMRTGSFLGAMFRGDQEKEATWFSALSSLPVISMDAERAARQVAEATRRGDAEIVLSLPARLDMWAHGLFPGLTIRGLGLWNRLLMPKGAGRTAIEGRDVRERLETGPLAAATTFGRRAAQRFQDEPHEGIQPSESGAQDSRLSSQP
jgi:NAD(P)-dependent dehydrogenase (short-subunit alcohol dehydrogenase family)